MDGKTLKVVQMDCQPLVAWESRYRIDNRAIGLCRRLGLSRCLK